MNLAIFLTVGIFILRKPLTGALLSRRENIKLELAKAQEERDRAAERLAEAQNLFARLDKDVNELREQARQEAVLERERQATAAENEIQKLKAQAAREIEVAHKTAERALRQFLADRSLELAKASVVNQLRPEDDNRFIKDKIDELRRSRA